ncbi:MAG: twin-arginine translocation signal domain-containing protein [Terriglobales bacterium]
MEGMTMTHTRRDFLKTATATAVLTAAPRPPQAVSNNLPYPSYQFGGAPTGYCS